MQLVTVEGIDPASIRRGVDVRTFARGLACAEERSVRHMRWDETDSALDAVVRGSRGMDYEVTVYFEYRGGADLEYSFGECTCPMGISCKHVVAAAIAATRAEVSGAGRGQPAPPWERQLGELLAPPASGHGASDAVPLAVELSVAIPAPHRGSVVMRPKLNARLVRPGRAGWVAGGLNWSRLVSPYHVGEHDPAHVRLLRELHALHRSGVDPGRYYYGGDDKTIDLATFGSRLWSFLEEAAEIGLPLVHARKRLGTVAPYGHAALSIDVTAGQDAGSLVIGTTLGLTGAEGPCAAAVPVMFLGAGGHGVVHVPPDQAANPNTAEWAFRLARFATPVPPALQRMVLDGVTLPVPAGQGSRFGTEFYPLLRRLAPVGSSDGSFTPPVISEPTLHLQAVYGEDHDLELRWEWTYEVGETQHRAPMTSGPVADYRDPGREQEVLDALDLPVELLGLSTDASGADTRLRGMDTMRFTTEILPLLADRTDVTVELSGEPVAYREAGDAVRIGLSTGEVAGETDWFDLGVSITVEGRAVPFADVFVALAGGESHLLLPDGAFFSLLKPELQQLRALIDEARSMQDGQTAGLRISRFQAGLWDELRALGVVEDQAAAWQEQVGGLLSAGGVTPTEPPVALTASLRPYQRDGFDWLCFLWRHRLGGILADDMGLGKTVQTLALICHAKQVDPAAPPFLVVAPTSVVSNWSAEAARFAPGLATVAITDTLRRRGQELTEAIAGADVVVTSYTLFRLDHDAYAAAEWSGLVLDEAQFTKNHQSKIYQCARRLPAPFKLAITGTPMENNLMELWSLLSITAPGLFPNPTRFRDAYARPIERQSDSELLARLRRRIAPLVKRRTKEQVATDLPAKQEQILEIELAPAHRRLYQRHLQRERQKVLGLIDDVDRNRFTILRSLTLLRQLSLHPGLVETAHQDLGSAKIDALAEQLREVVDGGHRALVFSQFTGFLAHVRARLDADGVPYCYLDGSTRNRKAVVSRFKDGDAPVFLISLKAGGFGLNLTEADYCFLLDPWWNPATETQAIDRTHRIGQTRTVLAYRLIAKDTIEEKVHALATRKAKLFAGVMNDGNAFGGALGADDIRALLA